MSANYPDPLFIERSSPMRQAARAQLNRVEHQHVLRYMVEGRTLTKSQPGNAKLPKRPHGALKPVREHDHIGQ